MKNFLNIIFFLPHQNEKILKQIWKKKMERLNKQPTKKMPQSNKESLPTSWSRGRIAANEQVFGKVNQKFTSRNCYESEYCVLRPPWFELSLLPSLLDQVWRKKMMKISYFRVRVRQFVSLFSCMACGPTYFRLSWLYFFICTRVSVRKNSYIDKDT